MVYMLFDNPADKQNMTFLNGYETAKIRQIYPPQKCNSTKEMLAACKDVIKQSTEGDTMSDPYAHNTVRGMQHNLFIDSNPEADTRHRVSGLPLTFSRKETLQ